MSSSYNSGDGNLFNSGDGNFINNGDGNIFNQLNGEQTIYALDEVGLVQEWIHADKLQKEAFVKRIKKSALLLVLAGVGILFCIAILYSLGALSSLEAFFDFMKDLTTDAIGMLIGFIVASLIAVSGASGVSQIVYLSEKETRQREFKKLVRDRAEDIGMSSKEWRRQLKKSTRG